MDKTPATDELETQETLLSWSSPARLFKKRDGDYFKTIGAIVFLLTIILVFASEYVLVIAMLSIVFLIYVLSTVPPEEVEHRITNLGIESAGHYYRYEEFADFWLEDQWGQTKLVLRPYVGVLTIILLGANMKDKVRELLAKHLPFREQPEKTWVDNASSWLSKKIPLEKTS